MTVLNVEFIYFLPIDHNTMTRKVKDESSQLLLGHLDML